MRICLITPAHLSTNPRLVKEADAFSEAGNEVIVIAATFAPWAREADTAFGSRPWNVLEPEPFGPLAPPVRRGVQLVRYHGARWLVGHGFRSPPIVHAAWHPVVPHLVAAAKRVRADLYVAHYPAALPAAATAARIHGAGYAFDAEDFHLGDPPDGPSYDRQRFMVDAIERRYLPGCAFVTAASPGIAAAYAEAYSIELPTVVLNVFPRSQGPSEPSPRGWMAPGPTIYWFSQTIGPDRGLEAAVRAIGVAECKPQLHLRGAPSSGFGDRLESIATESGVSGRLHLLPPAPPDDMVRLAAAFDVGLVGETGHSRNRRIALTNKLFAYLLAGIPALATNIEAHRGLAETAAKGLTLYNVDDPHSLARAIDGLLMNPATLAASREAAFRLGQNRYNWDVEKRVLLGCVDRAFGDRGAAAR